jgi:hypothetical protein
MARASRSAFSPGEAVRARDRTARTKTMSVGIAIPNPSAAALPQVIAR